MNLYTYCGNDPIDYFDPSGHWTLSQYDNLGSGMYARLKEEGISILQLNPVSMLMNSYKQWKALLNNDITVAEVYAAGFESIISDYKYVLDGKNNFVKAYMPLKSGASDKEVYNAGYHIAGIIIDLATAGVAVDDVVKAVRANRSAIKIAESSQKGKLKLDYQRFAKKDLKMVNDAAREVGVDRNAFGEYIHELKSDLGMKASQNFTYKELKEYAKQLKKYMDIFKGLSLLLDNILPYSDYLKKARNKYNSVGLNCYLRSDFGQVGFQLSDEAICKLAKLGLCLDFHILSFGAVKD